MTTPATGDGPAWGTRLRGLALNLLLSLGVSAFFLAAIEGLARVLEPNETPASRDFFPDWRRWEADFYRFGAAPPAWPPAAGTNRDGLRDRHHALDTPPGLTRVVCLGDSVTYGYQLKAEEAWPQRLQGLLDERGGRLELLSAAAPGWSTRQQRIAYRQVMRRYKPARVLVGVCLNDVPELQNNLARPPHWLVTAYRRSALARRLIGAQSREIGTVSDLFRKPDSRAVREGFERFFDELRGLRDEVAADGARLGLIVFPFRFQIEADAPPPDVQRRLCAFAAAEGLDCIDLLPALRPLGGDGFIDWCHLSPAGTLATARALVGHPALAAPAPFPELLRAAGLADAPFARLAAALRSAAQPELRAAAAWSLGTATWATEPRATALGDALADADPQVRLQALRALRTVARDAHGLSTVRGRVLLQLDEPRESLRLAAAETLWAWGTEAGDVSALADLLGHDDPYMAAFAEASLQRLEASATVAALARALRAAAPSARRRAARLLGQHGERAQAAVAALTLSLDDPDRGVRRQSARALGLIGAPSLSAVARLEAALGDDDPGTREAARQALARLGRRRQ